MRKRTCVAVVGLIAALASSGPTAVVAQGCDVSFKISKTRNAGDIDNGLGSLAVVGGKDIWAVGNSGVYGDARSTLAEHWDGTRWTIAPTPDGPNEVNWLIGAAAVATDDVWAVGYSATNPPESSTSVTLIEHWDGTSWSVVPSPNPEPPLSGGPVSNELYSVAAIAPDDVWAVGQSFDYGASQTLVVHWDGVSWEVVHAPGPGRYSVLRSVSAVATDDVWAVGTRYVRGSQVTLAEHWDGVQWSAVPSPNDGPFVQELFRVRAIAADDVWAVGYHNAVFGTSQSFQTTILHWDGVTWSVVPSPDMNELNNYLFSVDGTAANDAWAVGFFDTGSELQTMVQHWDGRAWRVVASPNVSDIIDELTDVAAISRSNVWTVGQTFGFFNFRTLAMHGLGACEATDL